MRLSLLAFMIVACALAQAQFDAPAAETNGLGKEYTSRYMVGLRISATSGACTGIVATIPVLADWPEQTARVDTDEISNLAQARFRMLDGGVKQMLVAVPQLPAGETAEVLITYEVTRREILPPADPNIFVIPKRPAPAVRKYLGPSPYIETRQGQIKAKAKELLAEHADAHAYAQVEAIYDWVRANVEQHNGKLKGAFAALRDKSGDEEDITSLFIALCRSAGVPARTVWIPEACYAEFYLEDAKGTGHWLPCRLTGPKEFGGINEQQPILQKGDNFKVPEEKQAVRFVPEFLKGSGGRPDVEFVRAPLGSP